MSGWMETSKVRTSILPCPVCGHSRYWRHREGRWICIPCEILAKEEEEIQLHQDAVKDILTFERVSNVWMVNQL